MIVHIRLSVQNALRFFALQLVFLDFFIVKTTEIVCYEGEEEAADDKNIAHDGHPIDGTVDYVFEDGPDCL